MKKPKKLPKNFDHTRAIATVRLQFAYDAYQERLRNEAPCGTGKSIPSFLPCGTGKSNG